ncbi:MAG: dual OB domain-containing protein [Verrucomicrobiota bacterium]
MAEEKLILILANSIREKNRCVAGKELIPSANGYKCGKWIRLADPRTDGPIKTETAVCVGHGPVKPLDLVKVKVRESCGDPDHPEDWWIEPGAPWEFVRSFETSILPRVADESIELWEDPGSIDSVASGYVRGMGEPATLFLMEAPKQYSIVYWKENGQDWSNPGHAKEKKQRRLWVRNGKRPHEFSITDPEFMSRHDLISRMTTQRQELELENRDSIFFCVSLTPEYNGRHYKICATIFEPDA